MGLDSPTHILILLIVLGLLFGSAKLPKLAKSLGESMNLFKREAQKIHKDDTEDKPVVQGTVQQPLSAPPQQPVVQQTAAQQPVVQQPVVQQPVAQQPADPAQAAGAQVPDPQRTDQAG